MILGIWVCHLDRSTSASWRQCAMPGWTVKLKTLIRSKPTLMSWLEMNPVSIRQAEKDDLAELEWNGEYKHFRRLYADTYTMAEHGAAIIWIAELNGSGLI